MDESVDYEKMVIHILPELFRSNYMSGESEHYRKCPVCSHIEYAHEDLAMHMVDEHPTKLKEYADSILYMLKYPVSYFAYQGQLGMNMCSICGEQDMTNYELNRHMLSHKEYFHDIIKWLRERAK